MRPVRHARRRVLSTFGALLIVAGLLPVVATASTSGVIISEFRFRGPAGGNDEFVELVNAGTGTVDIGTWRLQGCSSAAGTASNRAQVPAGVVLAPGQHYLFTNNNATGPYSGSIPGDTTYGTGFSDGAGARLTLADGATVIDGVGGDGIGGTQCREGTGISGMPTANGDQSYERIGGTQDTDNNAVDFAGPKAGDPQNSVGGDAAPSITSRAPADGATGVLRTSDVSITFSEAVNVSGSWYSISCGSTGAHTAVVTGGPTVFTLNPDTDFAFSETCTVTISGTQVSDQDAVDPPDNVAGNPSWSFTTESAPTLPTRIHDIQGSSHTAAILGPVTNVNGIVTGKRSNGFYMQDPNPDLNDATSEGILVFTSSAPSVNVGDAVRVAGTVVEFRPGASSSANLTITEITGPTITVVSTGNPLPATTVIGTGGRVPPAQVIEDDASGSVETSGVFDPAADGIDFYESLEHMRIQVNNAVVVGPRNSFGELFVVADNGAGAAVRTARGGIVIRDLGAEPPGDYRSGDFNPERMQLDDAAGVTTPSVSVGDGFTTPVIGVLDYDFGNFEIEVTSALTRADNGLARESTAAPGATELSVATFNVENLDANEPQSKFDALAAQIVTNMRAPDVVSLEEIQDNNGATNDSVVDANVTLQKLVDAIAAIGGPTYQYRQINPVDDQDGGEPGGNIRVGFIFRTDRGLAFVDRPGGGSTTPTTIVTGPDGKPQLSSSPGRVDPTNSAWNASRKPLAGEFTFRGETYFLVTNHFNSKGGDNPLFGRFQPPVRTTEVQRHQQAQIVNNFADAILAVDPNANVIVLGDINDFEFSQTMAILEGGVLHALMDTLPQNERYSYVFEGNSQSLDHIVVSTSLLGQPFVYDAVHVNAEFFDQLSDHDPQVARFFVNTAPTAGAGGPYSVGEGSSVTVSATGTDANGDTLTYAWDLDNNGSFETAGQSVSFSAAAIDGPVSRTIRVQVSDGLGATVDSTTVNITNVAPTATFNAPASTFAGFSFTISLTSPSDPSTADTAGGFTYAFDCGDGAGYGPFGTASSRSCPTSDTGARTVGGKIQDKDGGVNEYTATVNVVVTHASLCDLGKTYVSRPAAGKLLCATLGLAAAADARGNTRTEAALLRSYRLQVDLFRRTGVLTLAEANTLKLLSTRL